MNYGPNSEGDLGSFSLIRVGAIKGLFRIFTILTDEKEIGKSIKTPLRIIKLEKKLITITDDQSVNRP